MSGGAGGAAMSSFELKVSRLLEECARRGIEVEIDE